MTRYSGRFKNRKHQEGVCISQIMGPTTLTIHRDVVKLSRLSKKQSTILSLDAIHKAYDLASTWSSSQTTAKEH
jgi:hypothetical protein